MKGNRKQKQNEFPRIFLRNLVFLNYYVNTSKIPEKQLRTNHFLLQEQKVFKKIGTYLQQMLLTDIMK